MHPSNVQTGRQQAFQRFAWGLLAYNFVVILGGAFVRASMSGDGCGKHWPDCQGTLIPKASSLGTVIEFGHRLSTGLLLPLVLALVVWAFLAFPKRSAVRGGAVGVLLLVLFEAWVGAVLVKHQLVAYDKSVQRAIVMPLHLIATFALVLCNTVTAWWAGGARLPRFRGQGMLPWALALGLLAAVALGMSGAITALGDTLFPAATAAEIGRAVEPGAHFLKVLRQYHPFISLAVGGYLALLAAACWRLRPDASVERFARWAVMLYAGQLCLGALNLGLQAPIALQLAHLLLANLFWVALVLMCASALGDGVPQRDWADPTAATGDVLQPEAARSADPPAAGMAVRASYRDYIALTKPRVISLLLLTALLAMPIAAGVEGVASPSLWTYLAVAFGFYMAAGAANAINMVLERDLDERMGRTSHRPIVTAAIRPANAILFAAAMIVGSVTLLWAGGSLLSALMAMAGLVFYVVIYTLLLKRRTWQNIVIGGAAGAFPPLVGWAAVTGSLSPVAWCLFGIIFLWTPVHFWALAILLKDDYARAGVPMLPVVRGDRATTEQIAGYAVLTVVLTVLPMFLPARRGGASVGWIYVGAVALLNVMLLHRSYQLLRHPDHARARSLFKYSMVYLALLFAAMAIDQGLRG